MTIRAGRDYPVGRTRNDEPDLSGEADKDGVVRELAHDLRQPLAAIRALAAAAAADVDAAAPVLQRLAQITDQANWISAAIDDALKPDVGIRAAVAQQPVFVRALVRAVVATERLTYRGRINFDDGDSDDRYVIVTATRLRRAVANVLANATRAAGPLGDVGVSVISDGGLEIVEISDNGPGFGRLGQEHGIGLQVTRSVLMESGGWLETERLPGGLTVVRLNLPVAGVRHQAGAECA
jgi:two-component system, OmpR family, sensor kinase